MVSTKRKHKNNRYDAKRQRSNSESHWLGEGDAGREYLIENLDPALVAIDHRVARMAANIARNEKQVGDPLVAMLFFPGETPFWQVSYLLPEYQVYLVNDDDDDIQERGSWEFGFEIISPDKIMRHQASVSLVIQTDNSFANFREFSFAVRVARRLLTEAGKAIFILRGEQNEDNLYIRWNGEEVTSLAEIVSAEPDSPTISLFGEPPCQWEAISLNDFFSQSRPEVPDFLRRNKKYFGPGMDLPFFDRISKPDFTVAENWIGTSAQSVIILSWNGLIEKSL